MKPSIKQIYKKFKMAHELSLLSPPSTPPSVSTDDCASGSGEEDEFHLYQHQHESGSDRKVSLFLYCIQQSLIKIKVSQVKSKEFLQLSLRFSLASAEPRSEGKLRLET